MARTLPSLSALLAFEADARRLSFSRAAEDLHFTPGAISQQVRLLEGLLGESLFARTKRSVALTEVGMQMLPDARFGLEIRGRLPASLSPQPAGH
jgi:LysR family transcriptional regulator, glycine cleavage system transcriptional activator